MVKFHWDLGKWDLWCMGHFSENSRSLQNVCLKIWRHNIVTGWRDNIRSCFRAIECGVSTGFIWVCTQTLRWHQCTRLGDAFHPWVWNSFINSFSKIWTVQLLITSDYILLILAKTVLLLWPFGWYNAENNQQWFLSVSWRHAMKSPAQYPQLNPHAHCVSVACSVTPWSTRARW